MKKPFIPATPQGIGGFFTIELLIAFSVGIIFITAAMMVSFSDPTLARQVSIDSGQVAALDTRLDNSALATSSNQIGTLLAKLSSNWNAIVSTPSDETYTNMTIINDISPCLKEITTETSWNSLGSRARNITNQTAISNIAIAKGLGGDCDFLPPSETWREPRLFSSHNFNPGKPSSIDVLQKIVYITDDQSKLQLYDSSSDTLGSNSGFTITPYADAGSKNLNDIDAVQIGTRKYALIARHDTTGQFQVIDVTTPGTYFPSPLRTLGGTTPPTGSFPQGWRVFYFDKRAYVTTRETAGYEFHIFDLTTPLNPVELGPAFEINGTANDLLVTSITINGHTYTLAFLATSRSTNEVMVLNVTNPALPTLLTSMDIPTTNDALSVELLGNRLYIGRQKTNGGPELMVYHVTFGENGSTPTVALSPIGSGAEINYDVTHLRIIEKFAFLANLSPDEFGIWDISHPEAGFSRIDTDPLIVSNRVFGIDYEAPYVYVASQANDGLQILYSSP